MCDSILKYKPDIVITEKGVSDVGGLIECFNFFIRFTIQHFAELKLLSLLAINLYIWDEPASFNER